MLKKFWTMVVLLAIVSTALPARGDIPAPKPPKDESLLPLTVKIDRRARNAILQIPKNLLAKASAPNDHASDSSSGRTIIAGLAMSLAVVSFGWMRWSKGPKQVAVGILLICVFGVGIVRVAYANAPPPFLEPKLIKGLKVKVEIIKKGEGITLVIPSDMLDQFNAEVEGEESLAEEKTES